MNRSIDTPIRGATAVGGLVLIALVLALGAGASQARAASVYPAGGGTFTGGAMGGGTAVKTRPAVETEKDTEVTA